MIVDGTDAPDIARPASCTHFGVNLAGLLGGIAVAVVCVGHGHFDRWVPLLIAGAIAVTIIVLERIVLRRPFLAASVPLPGRSERVLTRWLGLVGTLSSVALAYWVLPEYREPFYEPFFDLAVPAALGLVLLSPLYFLATDGRVDDPEDAYGQVGRICLGRFREAVPRVVGQHFLGWTVKAFFLPLMYVYFHQDLQMFIDFPPDRLRADFVMVFDQLWSAVFLVDVAFAVVGYLLTLRLFDSHIRSTEPTLLGWAVAIVCYEPFWNLVYWHYLRYDADWRWDVWLADWPILKWAWGGTILALIAVYSLATVTFGIRFSNLTHRGILTNGPYRFTRHPAYVAKGLTWWMVSMPFLSQAGFGDAVRRSLMLLGVSAIYLARAWTEERHLGRDPTYRRYARWIDRRGLFAPLGRVLPFLRFGRRFPDPG